MKKIKLSLKWGIYYGTGEWIGNRRFNGGEIDLPGFFGLEPPEALKMDKLPGYKSIKANVKLKGDADPEIFQELHQHFIRASPVDVTLTRPVKVSTALEII